MTKNIIYLDTELLNSTIAQIEGGVVTGKTKTLENNETTTNQTGLSGNISAKFKVPFAELGAETGGSTGGGNSVTTAESDLYSTIFHDFSLDVLLDDLFGLIKSEEKDFNIGDFVLVKSSFKVFDFKQLQHVTDHSLLMDLKEAAKINNSSEIAMTDAQLKELKKKKNKTGEDYSTITKLSDYKKTLENPMGEATSAFKMVNTIARFGDALYPETLVFQTKKSITLANKKDLRISTAQVSALSNSSNEISVLGIVLTKQADTENTVNYFNSGDLGGITNILQNAMLDGFDILHVDDNVIQPIAIYFE